MALEIQTGSPSRRVHVAEEHHLITATPLEAARLQIGILEQTEAHFIKQIERMTIEIGTLRAQLRILGDLLRLSGVNDYNPSMQILGLDPRSAFAGLTEKQIKRVIKGAYKTRLEINHPDTGGDVDTVRLVNIAADRLGNPDTRGQYRR